MIQQVDVGGYKRFESILYGYDFFKIKKIVFSKQERIHVDRVLVITSDFLHSFIVCQRF